MYTARSQRGRRTHTRYRYGVPDQPKTPHRTFRADDESWAEFCTAAEINGTDASTLLRAFIDWYSRRTRRALPRSQRRPTVEEVEGWKRRHPPRKKRLGTTD